MALTKLILFWFLVATVTLVAGWLLLLHGGVHSEAATRSGDSAIMYEMEVILGQILMWPIFSAVWIKNLFSEFDKTQMVGAVITVITHYIGYALIFIVYGLYTRKRLG